MSAGRKKNRWCFVPMCTSTDKSTPGKVFLCVPADMKRRRQWWVAARREFPVLESSIYCCQDHFNLEEDMENYLRYSMVGGNIKLKADVLPHKFECQGRSTTVNENRAALKRKRILQQLMKDQENEIPIGNLERQAKRRANISTDVKIQLVDIKKCEGVNIIDDMVRGAEEIEVIETLENRTGLLRKIKTEPLYSEGEVEESYGSSSNLLELEDKGHQPQQKCFKVNSQDTPVKMANKAHHPQRKQHQLENKKEALCVAADDARAAVSINDVVPMESKGKKRSLQKRNQLQIKVKEVDLLGDKDEAGELYNTDVERRLEEEMQPQNNQIGIASKHSSFSNPGSNKAHPTSEKGLVLSEAETQALINLVLERRSILLSRELDFIEEKNDAWEEVVHLFNSDSSSPATIEQLKECWDHIMKTMTPKEVLAYCCIPHTDDGAEREVTPGSNLQQVTSLHVTRMKLELDQLREEEARLEKYKKMAATFENADTCLDFSIMRTVLSSFSELVMNH